MTFTPPVYDPQTGIVMLAGRDQIMAYYEQFRLGQMESFAEFVLSKGHGAVTPHGIKGSNGRQVPETWQACGRRLFGERFVGVMERAVDAYRAAHAGHRTAPVEIPDPDF
jgi:hypothetical protein